MANGRAKAARNAGRSKKYDDPDRQVLRGYHWQTRRTDGQTLQSTAFIPVLAALLVVFHWSSHLGLSHLLQRSPGFFAAFVINRVGGHNLFFFFFWLQTTWLIDDFLVWR